MKAEVGVRWVVTWWEPEATNRKGGEGIGYGGRGRHLGKLG